MTEEQELELQILNYCKDYIYKVIDEQIKDLTNKALSLKIIESDRLVILGGRVTLISLQNLIQERRQNLLALKQKER